MKSISLKCTFLLCLVFFTSCVSFSKQQSDPEFLPYPTDSGSALLNYWNNRVMDFRDIFSIQFIWGLNAGAKVQVSRMGLGLYGEIGSTHPIDFSGEVGIRSGEWGSHSASDLTFFVISTDDYQPTESEKSQRAESRNKVEIVRAVEVDPASWTRLGVAGGIFLVGFRAEFNPGEILDFVLGIFTIDIYKDDVYQKSPKPKNTDRQKQLQL